VKHRDEPIIELLDESLDNTMKSKTSNGLLGKRARPDDLDFCSFLEQKIDPKNKNLPSTAKHDPDLKTPKWNFSFKPTLGANRSNPPAPKSYLEEPH
jgi:hypothetical protein